MKKINLFLTVFAAIFGIAAFFTSNINAQRRDYLTDDEIEVVRDAQEIDLRVKVLTYAVERRLAVINNKPLKEKEIWGAPPKGSRVELFLDIEKLIQKAIDDVDQTAERAKDSKLFPKAVHQFADSCTEYLPQFKTFLDTTKDEKTRGALIGATENCNQVIEAAAKVPKEPSKEEKKKKN